MPHNLKTNRLELIPLNTTYLESTHEYAADKSTTRYMIYLPNKTVDDTYNFLKYVETCWEQNNGTNDILEYAIIYQGQHIGAISMYVEGDKAEIGWIINKKYQRQGLAFEAASTLIEFTIKKYKIAKIIAHSDILNVPSYKLMEKLGFNRILIQERTYPDERGQSREYQYELLIRE